MKKILFTLSLAFIAFIGFNNAIAQESGAKIEFKSDVVDYGTIDQHSDGLREFVFTNTGDAPLIISNAKGSCGCTVPTWPKEPIAPGATASIKVKYATNRVGAFNKTVTLTSNAVNEPTKVVRIKGNVLQKPAGGAPINNSGAPTAN
ncbi:MAG: DUF1573 domain-containing protein [Brumimicrobium sp.]